MKYEQRIKWLNGIPPGAVNCDDLKQIAEEMVFLNDLALKYKDECSWMMGRAMKAELLAAKSQTHG